jgi:phosphatidylglycerol:prolipoprotein diacylglycerol transferase
MLATISIGIDPIALRLGSLSVHWYGICYVVAFVVAYYLGARPHAMRRGISEGNLERLAGWSILFGLIGARLYYDVQNLDLMHNVVDVIAVWNGGMAFYGAVVGGIATLVVLGWRWHLPVWVLLDGGAFFAVVGQPIGRIGNIINGDILGGPSNLPWATAYTNPDAVLQPGFRLGVAYQPAGAYEALGTLVILLILLAVRRRRVRPGIVIISYVALYSVSQFLLGFLRESEPKVWLGFKELQLTAIATLVVAVPALIVVWRRTQGRAGGQTALIATTVSGTDVSAESGGRGDPDGETETDGEAEADTEPEPDTEPETDIEPEPGTEPEPDTEQEAVSEVDTATGPDTEPARTS